MCPLLITISKAGVNNDIAIYIQSTLATHGLTLTIMQVSYLPKTHEVTKCVTDWGCNMGLQDRLNHNLVHNCISDLNADIKSGDLSGHAW